MKYNTLHDIQEYLYTFRTKVEKDTLKDKFLFSKQLAKALGNPQNKIKVVHAAGTSGKGSTCAIISHLLVSAGFRVGLSISPHLYDLRERAQINNEIVSEEKFCTYFNEVRPHIEALKDSKYPPSFFEIMIVLAYYIFWKERVHYAVMETGQGGRWDATNIADDESKIAVLTKFGLDHIDILGDTLTSIAREKAAIIHQHNMVVKIKQRPTAQREIAARAKEMETNVNIIKPERNFAHKRAYRNKLRFDFSYKQLTLDKLKLSLQGIYQVENASLALAVLYELSKRDQFDLNEEKIRDTLLHMKAPGRFEEIIIHGKRIIIDGAHNPQKMSAFIRSLKNKHKNQKFDFLIGFKHGKDYADMIKYIIPVAHTIYVSAFKIDDQIDVVTSEPVEEVKQVLNDKFNFTAVEIGEDTVQTFEQAKEVKKRILVVTGSLYLISELYKNIRHLIEEAQKEEEYEL